MGKKIVILDAYVANPGDLSWDGLKQFGDLTVYDRTQDSDILSRAAGAYALFVNKVKLTADILRRLPELKYIGVLATGFNNIDIATARELGIVVCNVPNYSTNSVAQLVFAHLLNIVNQVGTHSASVKQGDWQHCADFSYKLTPLLELNGATMAVYGLGNIGKKVAGIANAFGMKVISFTSKSQDQLPDYIRKVTKEEMFAQADVLSLNAPLSADNMHIVNADTLRLMKPSAIIINTARGGLVDEKALADSLNAGRLYAAGVDVLETEPPVAENPLVEAKNCFITPHVAWQSDTARADLLRITVENLAAFVAGTPKNKVN